MRKCVVRLSKYCLVFVLLVVLKVYFPHGFKLKKLGIIWGLLNEWSTELNVFWTHERGKSRGFFPYPHESSYSPFEGSVRLSKHEL